MGQPVRSGLQLGVRQPAHIATDGDRVGSAGGLPLEQVVQAQPLREVDPGIVPVAEHQPALGLGQPGEPGKLSVRIVGDAFQDGEEMADHPAHRLRVEQVLVVSQHALDGAVPLLEGHLQVGLAGVLLDVVLLDLQAPHGEPRPGRREEEPPGAELLRAVRLLQREGDLHQRRAAGIALEDQPLHQQGEGIVLVLEGVEHGGPDAAEQPAEGRVARQVGAEGQHVDEVADHVLESGSAPAGERAADQEILLAGVPAELHLERGQQHGVERGRLARRQRLEPADQVRPEPPGDGAAAPGEDRRARPVGRQVEHRRRAGELPLPVFPEPLALGAGQQVGLPVDEVAVFLGRGRQRRGPAVALGRVERLHLLQHQDQRPEVTDDVVDGQQEDVIVRGASEEVHAHQRPSLQVERAVRLRLQPSA